MPVTQSVINLLINVLHYHDKVNSLNSDSKLIGAVPEFDSMAVVSIITALEEHFGFVVDDDEIDASVFETVGSLVAFVEGKL
jgi:acyl carrier protein